LGTLGRRVDHAQSNLGNILISVIPSGLMSRNTGKGPATHEVPCITSPSKNQFAGMVMEYARIFRIGSTISTCRVWPEAIPNAASATVARTKSAQIPMVD